MAIDWEQYGRQRQGTRQAQSSTYRTGSHIGGTPYVDGNTVRKMSAVPQERPDASPEREPKRYPQRKPVRMPGFGARGFAFLLVVAGIITLTGFSYLSAQSDLRELKNEVVSLQAQNEAQKEENDEAYQSIVDSVDLSEIYEKATKKLKMVQAKSNQIYTYNDKKSDMVKQYADIPDAE